MNRLNKDISINTIKVTILISIFLLAIIGLINYGYIGQTITIIFTFIFGYIGYWLIFPLMLFLAIFFIIKKDKKINPLKNVYFISGGLILFGILILTSVLAYYPSLKDTKALSISTFTQYFYDSWLKSINVNSFNNYIRFNPLSSSLGGGFFGHLFAGLLNSGITSIGSIIASSIIILIGVIAILFNPIKKGVKIASKKYEIKKQENEEKRLQEEAIKAAQRIDAEVTSSATLKEETIPTPIIDNDISLPNEFKHASLFDDDEVPTFDDEDETINKDIKKEVIVDDSDINEEINEKPYILPSFDLLEEYDDLVSNAKNEEKAKLNLDIINRSFERLHIGAKAIGFTIGPRVTRFDIQIDENASIQAIPKYVKDIGQRLGGVRPRFEEIVTGKMTSGLEIPNAMSSTISFKEIISSLSNDKNVLTIPFGKDISGEIKYANLAKFPHMLVAGSTGSGKSVFIHSIIMTLIMRNTPNDLRLLLVDPKQVEFTKYKNSPFLLCPTITEPSKAKVALEKLCEEMDRRYKIFADASTNQITSYNEMMKLDNKKPLPYIVVIVDEFADLIQQNKKIDGDINRIAQKARAAGIHLIIATQRPSVDVITGTIKANLPVRVALFVSDQESSKTILGSQGAEGLLGNGDMLVSCPQVQTQGNFRCQSPFVQDKEIVAVNKYINEQRKPTYDPRFLSLDEVEVNDLAKEGPKLTTAELKAQSDDELYELIKETIYKREYTSISSIQREFEIGFNRAGRMFKRLLNDRLVSQMNESSKGNKVLKENFAIKENEQVIGSVELTTTRPNGDDL